jgi:hypothetical protein
VPEEMLKGIGVFKTKFSTCAIAGLTAIVCRNIPIHRARANLLTE